MKKLPPGYEIRSVNELGEPDGKYVKVTPYYKGQPISEGEYPGISGFASATRKALKAIRIHRRWGMDGHR